MKLSHGVKIPKPTMRLIAPAPHPPVDRRAANNYWQQLAAKERRR